MSRRNRSRSGGGFGRFIRRLIKVKLVILLIIIVVIGLIIWGIVSLIGGLFRSSNLALHNNDVAVVQVVDVIPNEQIQ